MSTVHRLILITRQIAGDERGMEIESDSSREVLASVDESDSE